LTCEAAVELVIGHRSWLVRDDFLGYVESCCGFHGESMAAIDWRAAWVALEDGQLPCSRGERQILRVAASLAEGVPIDLCDAVSGLDAVNLGRVARALTGAGGWVAAHPPEEVLALPESSWGQAGNHFTWLNADTEWMWPIIHAAERRMEQIVEQHPAASGALAVVLNQCARELLLLESSDWPFLVTTGQAREYAVERFESHVERFNRLAQIGEAGEPGVAGCALAEELWELDRVFPEIDYRVFRRREPAPT